MGEPLPMLARLGRETLAFHGEADADLDRYIFGPRTTAQDYRTFLWRTYGFISAFENALADTPELQNLIDVRARMKAPLLLRDLFALGMTVQELADRPQWLAVPAFRGPAAALGWMYVAERPLLASSVIRRHLATRLPSEVAAASQYLNCYAGQTGAMWRELGEAIQKVAATPAIADRIIASAQEAFRALHRWRRHDLQQPALAV